jgi:hypothetical protein
MHHPEQENNCVRTNVKRRLRATAGISVALTTAALSVVLSSPANAEEATPSPTAIPTAAPTLSPTPFPPTASPTGEPTTGPTTGPTVPPTAEPTSTPSPEPTEPGEGEDVTVRGRIWNDKNRNGIQDTGEPGLANVPVVVFSLDEGDDLPEARSKIKGLTEDNGLTKKAPKARAKADDEGDEGELLTGADGRYEVTGIKIGKTGKVVVLALPAVVNPNTNDFASFWSLTKPDQGKDATKDSDLYPTPISDPEVPELKEFGTLEFTAKPGSKVTVDAGLFRDEETPSSTPAPGGGGGPLPNTGLAIGGFLIAGVALIGGGTALTIVARRRRQVVA